MNRLQKSYIYLIVILLSIGQAYAQEKQYVKGTVYNAIGNTPLTEVLVSKVDSELQVKTDENGKFSIDADDNSVLEVWTAGFQQRRIEVKTNQDLIIYLFPEGVLNADTEVQNYLYSKTLRNSATALQSIGDDEMELIYPSFESSLQGKTPGLMVINRSGMPGDGASVFSRGITSLNLTNSPIIVVDGMIYYNAGEGSPIIDGHSQNPYIDIDPTDIESISYLKGGTSSMLGSLGGNDVLVIKTKRANDLKTKVNFSMYGGVSSLAKTIPMLGSDEFVDYATSIAQSFLPLNKIVQDYPFLLDNPDYLYYNTYNNNTNWQDEVFDEAILQNYIFSIKGGDAIAKYYLSMGYLSQQGIVKETGLQKYSTRFNLDINLTDNFTLQSNIGFNYRTMQLAEFGIEQETNPVYAGLAKSPMLYPISKDPFGNELGVFDPYREFMVTNPAALLENQDVYSNTVSVLANVVARYKISPKWNANASFGYSYKQGRENSFIPGADRNTVMPTEDGEAENSVAHLASEMNSVYADAGVTYNTSWGNGHSFDFMTGIRYLEFRNEYDFGKGMNTVGGDQFVTLGQTSANSPRTLSGGELEFRLLTEYLRLGYDYKKKYFVGLNASLDGSSSYGSNVSRFSVFPGVNAAWLISNEDFLQNSNNVGVLKLRLDYAITGNGLVPSTSGENYYSTVMYREVTGIVRSNIANEDLKWEENHKLNVGLDYIGKKERIALTVDVFKHNISDLVLFGATTPISGFSSIPENVGGMENTGYDIGLNIRLIDAGFKWDIYGNVSKYNNKVTDLGGADKIITDIHGGGQLVTELGGSAYQFYGYKTDGIFTSQEEADKVPMYTAGGRQFNAGDVRFVNFGGADNVIGEDDKVVLGDPNPDFYGGFGTTMELKDFTLSADFTYSYGGEIYNFFRQRLESMSSFGNQTLATTNRWRYDGHQASYPVARLGDPMGNSRMSDRWIEDGSYMRVRELRLAYRLPEGKVLRSGEIYLAGYNLFTVTDYLGYDPEFLSYNNVRYMGIDYGRMPIPKSVILGIKVGL